MSLMSSEQEIMTVLADKLHFNFDSDVYSDDGKVVKLNISNLDLTDLPSEIMQLTNLQHLSIVSTRLELGSFSNWVS